MLLTNYEHLDAPGIRWVYSHTVTMPNRQVGLLQANSQPQLFIYPLKFLTKVLSGHSGRDIDLQADMGIYTGSPGRRGSLGR